jgi:hypothetical protein
MDALLMPRNQIDDRTSRGWGVYGFQIAGLTDHARHLHPAPPDWPRLELKRETVTPVDPEPPGTVHGSDDGAVLWIGGGGRIELRRRPLSVRFSTPTPLSDEEILHPYLGLPAAIAAYWHGRIALHSGAFVLGDRAWAVLGDREAGKSSTLGQLLRSGAQILSDDIVIVDGTRMFAGPRSVDLREDAAEFIGGERLGMIGNRPRWRLRPAAGPAERLLAGFVKLEWGERPCLERLGTEDRLQALIASSVLQAGPETAVGLLELTALPMIRFSRPAGLDQLAPLTELLRSELSQA